MDTGECDIRLDIGTVEQLLVDIALDIWGLSRAVEGLRAQSVAIPDEIISAVRRLEHDIEAGGLTFDDPIGRTYVPGMRVDIVDSEAGGEGVRLVIRRTVRPGVRLRGRVLHPAKVVVGRSNDR